MRHRKKGRKLNRTASHKKALMRNLANQLFEHKEIRTTTAKAKEARSTVERLITYAKKGDLHHRRLAFGFLRQKATIKMLFDEIAPTYADRQGGYTRILQLGTRMGDGASMSILQLVGFETLGETVKADKKKKARKKADKSAAADTADKSTDTAPEEEKVTTTKAEKGRQEKLPESDAESTNLPAEEKKTGEAVTDSEQKAAENGVKSVKEDEIKSESDLEDQQEPDTDKDTK